MAVSVRVSRREHVLCRLCGELRQVSDDAGARITMAAVPGVPAVPGERAALGPVSVRAATRDDMHHVLQMIQELAEYEGVSDGPQITTDELVRDGFESEFPWFFGLIAECDGSVVGHALCNRAYSSWTRRAFYVEDLYVRPHARRHRVGLRLLQELCKMAVSEGVRRVDWHVLENNAPALGFYERLGARDLRVTEGRAAMRLDGPRIEELAKMHI